jgi:HEAT repeat protein
MKQRLSLLVILIGLLSSVVAGAPAPAPPTKEEIKELVRQLGDDDFEVRERASRRLLEIGEPALGALSEAADRAEDSEVRRRARRAVDAITHSLPYLLGKLKDSRAPVRAQAARDIGRLGAAGKVAIPTLLPMLQDTDEGVRDAVLGALVDLDSTHEKIAKLIPAKASAEGKYKTLLRRIKVPADREQYKDYHDYGQYQATDWGGYTGLPAGYWVYVYPHWYIWRDQAK